jgi:hypothetical protein
LIFDDFNLRLDGCIVITTRQKIVVPAVFKADFLIFRINGRNSKPSLGLTEKSGKEESETSVFSKYPNILLLRYKYLQLWYK